MMFSSALVSSPNGVSQELNLSDGSNAQVFFASTNNIIMKLAPSHQTKEEFKLMGKKDQEGRGRIY